ncbi:MAG: hypothetical protein M3433_01590 [Actinomycetota bacterium]|nr:hypothetical protein [Actinomycetota bacterium]MDQ3647278.1 hypothetical protein [Actinomycetota bacterium]
MSAPVEALSDTGREAFERGDGAASRRAFEAALAEREEGVLFEGLARALYLEADYPASMSAHERAFAAYRDEGDALGAARAAPHFDRFPRASPHQRGQGSAHPR